MIQDMDDKEKLQDALDEEFVNDERIGYCRVLAYGFGLRGGIYQSIVDEADKTEKRLRQRGYIFDGQKMIKAGDKQNERNRHGKLDKET